MSGYTPPGATRWAGAPSAVPYPPPPTAADLAAHAARLMARCATCGGTSPAGARFCAACGAPLAQDVAAPPPSAQVSRVAVQAPRPPAAQASSPGAAADGAPGAATGAPWTPPALLDPTPPAPTMPMPTAALPTAVLPTAPPAPPPASRGTASAAAGTMRVGNVEEQTRNRDAARARWRAVFDSGESAEVGRLCLVGRNPQRGAGGQQDAELLAIRDPQRSVSKTHVAIGVDAEGPWVRDLGSTNGTRLREPNGDMVRLEPGATVHVPPTYVVLVGERVLTWVAG